MSRKIKVMGIQFEPKPGDKKANMEKVEGFLKSYSYFKPDLVVLPEVFLTGIVTPDVVLKTADKVPGETYDVISCWAKTYKCYLVAGSIMEYCSDGKCRNASILFDPQGKIIATYYKIHMFSYYGGI